MYYVLDKRTGCLIYSIPTSKNQKLTPKQVYKFFNPIFHKIATEDTLETARNMCAGRYVVERSKIMIRCGNRPQKQLDLFYTGLDAPLETTYVLAPKYLDMRVFKNTLKYPIRAQAESVNTVCNHAELQKFYEDSTYEPHFRALDPNQMYLEDYLDQNLETYKTAATRVTSHEVLLNDTDYLLADFDAELTREAKMDDLRALRQNEFILFDKYQLTLYWSELSEDQKTEYIAWRDAWMNVTETLTPPDRLEWFTLG